MNEYLIYFKIQLSCHLLCRNCCWPCTDLMISTFSATLQRIAGEKLLLTRNQLHQLALMLNVDYECIIRGIHKLSKETPVSLSRRTS